jgi:hypothetical protein
MHVHPKVNVEQARSFWKEYSKGLYGAPRAWAHKGENLIHAYRAVLDASVPNSMHLNMQDQAFMLAGMAIEILLKALLVNTPKVRDVVSAERPKKNDEKRLRKRFFRHNLIELAEEANFPLNDSEQRVALALSQYIYWRGRYVVPTEQWIDDFIPIEAENGLAEQVHHISPTEVSALIDRVIAEVTARLYAEA